MKNFLELLALTTMAWLFMDNAEKQRKNKRNPRKTEILYEDENITIFKC